MARYNYIVTEITKRCPYCGKTVGTETKADQTPPHLIILLLAIFPITIPYWILRYLAFKNPNFPKVGPKTFQCPHCYLPIRTDNYAVEDLDSKNLFLHKFKKWIYISYVIGAVCGVCVWYYSRNSCGFGVGVICFTITHRCRGNCYYLSRKTGRNNAPKTKGCRTT